MKRRNAELRRSAEARRAVLLTLLQEDGDVASAAVRSHHVEELIATDLASER